jgi:FixJ family two-component response regulator
MTSQTQPTIFIVDDDISVRESLELLLGSEGWATEAFASAQEFLSRPRSLAASCLLLDVNLPDLSGLDLQERIASDDAGMPIIFLTGCGDIPMTVRAMKAGVAEFLTKPFDDEVLLDAISRAIERSQVEVEEEMSLRSLRERHATLSQREQQVMALVVSGLLNKQVGGELGISEITVKAHRGRVMRKMKARSLAELVKISAKLRSTDAPDA